MQRKKKLLAGLLGVSLVVAACGGSDDDGGSDDSDATEESSDDGEMADEGSEDDGEMADEDKEDDGEMAEGGGGEFDSIGVSDTEIHIGMLADQSGAFAPLVTEIVEAQKAYFEAVNADGGVDGKQVILDVEDTAYDVAQTKQKYETLREQVAMISLSTGSPHTANLAEDFVEDDIIALPLTWYSGWAFDEVGGKVLGQNVLETYTNYCLESMNGLEYLNKNKDATTVSIISFPGEYGGDGAAGAALAAEALGMEVVYDGTGAVTPPSADNPSPDQSAVISEVVKADADVVWTTINPPTLAAIMGGAVSQGYTGLWSGNSPTYSFKLLASDAAPVLDEYYIQSTYINTWGADVPGMKNLVDTMTELRPNLEVSDVYILGWTQAQIAHALLEQAAADGNLTRSGIVGATDKIDVDFQGLAPSQTWSGDPNDYVVRSSYIYDIDLAAYNPAPLSEGTGGTGSVVLEADYTGELAQNYDMAAPCFVGS